MKNKGKPTLAAIVCAILLMITTNAGAISVNFDDFTGLYGSLSYKNYEGFYWVGFRYLSNDLLLSSWNYDFIDGNDGYAVDNGGRQMSYLKSSAPFTFNGAMFASDSHYAYDWAASSIMVKGYKGSELVGSATVELSSSEYMYLQADWEGIDKLVFISPETYALSNTLTIARMWTMDNLIINEQISAMKHSNEKSPIPNPEPGTIFLISTAMIGSALIRRKKHLQ